MPESARANTSQTIQNLQQAFKLALSLTLFYWFALWANWDVPKYGVLAIVIVSLGTIGASVDQALMRVFGTTFGVAFGFLYLALFSHDRIAMMMAFSAHITVMGFFMQTSRYPYAWYVAAFVPLTVWGDNYPHFESAFYFGAFRWLETTVGVLIYTVVDLVIWPRHAGDDLPRLGRSYVSSIRDLIASVCQPLQTEEGAGEAGKTQANVSRAIASLSATLRSACVDTPAVRTQKPLWELWIDRAQVLANSLGQSRESIATLELSQSPRLIQELKTEFGGIDSILEQIGVLWSRTEHANAGSVSDDTRLLEPGTLELDESAYAESTGPDRENLIRFLDQLRTCRCASGELMQATRVLFGLDSIEELSSFSRPHDVSTRRPAWNSTQLMQAFFPALAFIAAYAFWIFWDPPTGAKVPMFAAVVSLITLRTSVNPLAAWIVMFLSALLVVAPIYWFVMPRLSTGLELLTLIFALSFTLRYFGGRWPALKSNPLILFGVLTGISNQQRYLFQVPVDGALMLMLAGMIVTVVYYLCVPIVPGLSPKSA